MVSYPRRCSVIVCTLYSITSWIQWVLAEEFFNPANKLNIFDINFNCKMSISRVLLSYKLVRNFQFGYILNIISECVTGHSSKHQDIGIRIPYFLIYVSNYLVLCDVYDSWNVSIIGGINCHNVWGGWEKQKNSCWKSNRDTNNIPPECNLGMSLSSILFFQ
jgi:hypothetical protein